MIKKTGASTIINSPIPLSRLGEKWSRDSRSLLRACKTILADQRRCAMQGGPRNVQRDSLSQLANP